MIRKNKRAYSRLNAHHLIKYRQIGSDQDFRAVSFVNDISAGGISFHGREDIKAGAILEILIKIPLHNEPAQVTAKVVRTSPIKESEEFNVAVEFITIDKNIKEFINDRILTVQDKIKGHSLAKSISILFAFLGILSAVGFFLVVSFTGKSFYLSRANIYILATIGLLFLLSFIFRKISKPK